jgi:hypothetical protein
MFDVYEFLFAGLHFEVNCNELCSRHLKNEWKKTLTITVRKKSQLVT